MRPEMQDQAHVLESLPAYALGCLDPVEARLVARHVAGCYVCRTELSTYQTVVAHLLPVPDVAPPPELKGRLMDRVRGLSPAAAAVPPAAARQPMRQRAVWPWALASLAAIVMLAAASLLVWRPFSRPQVVTGPEGMRAILLQNAPAAPQASGFVIISADGQNGVLVVDALPQLDSTRQYQVWLDRDGESIRSAAFMVDSTGYRGVRLEAPQALLAYAAIRVTIEPVEAGGGATGDQVLHGSLHHP
jgi:anti-sigma-K factor RskA